MDLKELIGEIDLVKAIKQATTLKSWARTRQMQDSGAIAGYEAKQSLSPADPLTFWGAIHAIMTGDTNITINEAFPEALRLQLADLAETRVANEIYNKLTADDKANDYHTRAMMAQAHQHSMLGVAAQQGIGNAGGAGGPGGGGQIAQWVANAGKPSP